MRKANAPFREQGEIYWLRITSFTPANVTTLSINAENPIPIDSLSGFVAPKDRPWKEFTVAGTCTVEWTNDPREPYPGPPNPGSGTSGSPTQVQETHLNSATFTNDGAAANQPGLERLAIFTTDLVEKSIVSQPAAATQASASQTAQGGGDANICRHITVNLEAVAAQPDIIFNLRDGASGVGTILWSIRLALAAGQSFAQTWAVKIMGSPNTAMTLESAAAPAATNFACVDLGVTHTNG